MKLLCIFGFFCALTVVNANVINLNLTKSFSDEIREKLWIRSGRVFSNFRSAAERKIVSAVQLNTKMGAVNGSVLETCRRGQQYAAFFGMPYAKPPIGYRRFQAPVPADPWEDVYDATFERPICVQSDAPSAASEDCLYINVYTPSWNKNTKPKPVMVFIHGGAFIGGSSDSRVYSPDLFVESDVLLVTFNYRLGALGFLSFQTKEIPGNAGLKDQRLALRWVKDNIRSFGGDPDSVTIFGESAGSASVNYHVLSNSSAGLFHRAIMESGTAFAPWAVTSNQDILKSSALLAKKLGCPATGAKLVECLNKASTKRILEEQGKSLTLGDLLNLRPTTFLPTTEPDFEDAFITKTPVDILKSNEHNKVPVIIGSNSREGLLILPALQKLDPLNIASNLISFQLGNFFPAQVKSDLTFGEKNYLNSELRKFYMKMKPAGSFGPLKLSDIVSDIAFVVPIQFMASVLARGTQPVYDYVFTYDGKYGYYKRYLNVNADGVCHGDELGYLFYHELFRDSVNDPDYAEEELVADMMITLWTNFAKTGKPTLPNSAMKWLPRKPDQIIYANLNKTFNTSTEMPEPLGNRYEFWVSLVNHIVKSS